jgi:NTP pyrophosphatase (non-canonical NTP hydrolase)
MPERASSPPAERLGELLQRIRAFRDARDWGRFHTPRNLASAIAVESGELLEHFQWAQEPDGLAEKIDGISEELADVAIYVLELADLLGISMLDAIEAKLALNEQRYPIDLARGSTRKHTELRR